MKIRGQWRLNPQILKDKSTNEYIIKQIKTFFEINDKPEISPSLLWETFKAFTRGIMISSQAFYNKEKRKEQNILETEIKTIRYRKCSQPYNDNT